VLSQLGKNDQNVREMCFCNSAISNFYFNLIQMHNCTDEDKPLFGYINDIIYRVALFFQATLEIAGSFSTDFIHIYSHQALLKEELQGV
jgi:hypothetical protein